jgi:hypothetical protein
MFLDAVWALVLAATTVAVEPGSDKVESGAAPRARSRVAIGWAALVAGIVTALVVVLIVWLAV